MFSLSRVLEGLKAIFLPWILGVYIATDSSGLRFLMVASFFLIVVIFLPTCCTELSCRSLLLFT